MCSRLPPTIRVLAAVISRDGRYLLAKRPANKRHGGDWEFPGGKVEAGESDFEALSRELHEELGVTLRTLGRVWCTHRDGDSAFEIAFVEAHIDGEPQAFEHDAIAWVAGMELATYELAPSDVLCAATLLKQSSSAAQ